MKLINEELGLLIVCFMKSSEQTGDRMFPLVLTVRCLMPSPLQLLQHHHTGARHAEMLMPRCWTTVC